jgi:hypothetical protein
MNLQNYETIMIQGKNGVAANAVEIEVDCRLWFWWHSWFGKLGANNDLNIFLRFSMIFIWKDPKTS